MVSAARSATVVTPRAARRFHSRVRSRPWVRAKLASSGPATSAQWSTQTHEKHSSVPIGRTSSSPGGSSFRDPETEVELVVVAFQWRAHLAPALPGGRIGLHDRFRQVVPSDPQRVSSHVVVRIRADDPAPGRSVRENAQIAEHADVVGELEGVVTVVTAAIGEPCRRPALGGRVERRVGQVAGFMSTQTLVILDVDRQIRRPASVAHANKDVGGSDPGTDCGRRPLTMTSSPRPIAAKVASTLAAHEFGPCSDRNVPRPPSASRNRSVTLSSKLLPASNRVWVSAENASGSAAVGEN